ncbi:DUF4400 domain-containing protein [Vibrio owensii]|uniref:DUF4400 domain-containing protein n=1 Tax=Vibrio owensii TaxID=696485 RepID=UPI0018F1C1DC|nr:DUF4400 domain-containing protein [Vibrio owensii]
MADERRNSGGSDDSGVNVPIVSYLLRLCFRMLYVAMFAGFVCLLVELSLYAANKEESYHPAFKRYQAVASGMVENNSPLLDEVSLLAYLSEGINSAVASARGGVNSYTGYMEQNADTRGLDHFPVQKSIFDVIKAIYESAPNVTLIWLFVTLTWAAKFLTILSMALPSMLIVLFGVADGLAARRIAMYKGVRDSIDRLEYWMYATRSFFYIVFFFYLAIPNSLLAYHFMVPMACITALLVRQVVTNFKKYG